ncbi:hypothetical protein Hte_003637 [Hypoxylon texense]
MKLAVLLSRRSTKRDYHGIGGKQRYRLGAEADRQATESPAADDDNTSADADNVYHDANITINGGAIINITNDDNTFYSRTIYKLDPIQTYFPAFYPQPPS